MVVQCQPVGLENTHTSTLYGLNRLYVGIYMCVDKCMQNQLVKKNETMDLKESGKWYVSGFGERKEKGEIIWKERTETFLRWIKQVLMLCSSLPPPGNL